MEFSEIIDTVNFCDTQQPGNITDCHGVQRLAVILDCYKEWSQTAIHNTHTDDGGHAAEEADGFYCFMHDSLNYAKDENSVFLKLINDYNHLLFHHNDSDSFEILYTFFNQHIYENKGCASDICHMLQRNNRDRSEISKHEDRRSQLYHGFDSSTEITVQQTVDRIHSQYLHCYAMVYKLTRKERQSVQDTKIDDIDEDIAAETETEQKNDNKDDEDALLYTVRLRKVCSILSEKRNRDSRGRRNERNTANKFTTIIDEKKQDEQDEEMEEKEEKPLAKLRETKTHKINLKLRVGLERDGPEGNEYSFSYRYYYWKAYIKTDEQDGNSSTSKKNILRGFSDSRDLVIEPGNYGYKTWHWYIPKRYIDLKSEITQNKICSIGMQQFEDCVVKAQTFMQCDEIGKKLKSYGEWIYKYDICDDEAIQLAHILSLLLYCNYDILQAQFSATFRRLHGENDEQLKKRHREFANWGRYLREAVELYGDNIRGQYTDSAGDILINQSIKRLKFYHGINCELLFPRTIARFNGPTSTTTTISVAMAFAGGSNGLCLQLIRKDPEYKHSSFFNCVPLSDFTYEEERFFIGGLEPLQIATIIHTSTNTNYRLYIRSLNNVQNFIEGTNDGWAIHRVSSRMKRYISEMFRYCHCYDEQVKEMGLPQYILNLFRAYANSVTRIDLNLEAINSEKSVQGKYGFKRIRNLIMIDNDERQWVKMDTVGNIFRKCKELHVRSGYSINMVKLNKELMADLVGFIQSNNVIERFQQLSTICIYQPQQQEIKLQKAVKKYKKECKKHGWILDCNEKNKILKLIRN